MAREYKDSGIEWIGLIPKEWEFGKYKYIGTFVKGKLPKDQNNENKGLPIIGASEMLGKEYRTYTLDLNVPICSPIDILILWDGANAGIVANGCDGVVSSTTVKYSCNDSRFNNQYLYYLLKNAEPFFKSKVNGTTIPHMNSKYIDEYICIIPPLSEQEKIADYLDKVCGEADEMIALQEKMIEELKVYKQSIITEAVTKGLNPNVPMKNSGIDWIGEIPEGWKVVKLSLLTSKIGSGSTPIGGANVYVSEGVKFLRSQNVYFEGLDLSDVAHITDKIDKEMKGTRVLPGDVLLNITGGSIGRCYYVDETLGKANVNQHVSIIRPKDIDTKYLKYSLQSSLGQHQVSLLQTGGNREGLSAAALCNFKMLLPSKDEQQAIASFLDTKCSEIDSLIAIKQQKIAELKEYKKSVIYEYVTGKKEVI
ncbi:MAG: restriction endonuclease subunit S [Prevotella sp.]|nr:restriction endonuclease subunit S [Prevotella sp.]